MYRIVRKGFRLDNVFNLLDWYHICLYIATTKRKEELKLCKTTWEGVWFGIRPQRKRRCRYFKNIWNFFKSFQTSNSIGKKKVLASFEDPRTFNMLYADRYHVDRADLYDYTYVLWSILLIHHIYSTSSNCRSLLWTRTLRFCVKVKVWCKSLSLKGTVRILS